MLRPILLVLLFTLVPTIPADAQGTGGLLPRQITVDDVVDAAARLHLSREQRLALLEAHDAYAQACAGLFDGDVQWLLEHQDLLSLDGSGSEFTARDFFERRARVVERIGRLDAELFTTLESVLAPEQLPALARWRAARERGRWTDGALLWFAQAAGVDLVTDDVLPDDPAMEPFVVQYDAAATPLVRKLHDEAVAVYTELDARAEAGASAEERQAAATELSAEAFRTAMELGQLQRRVLASAAAVISPRDAAAMYARYGKQRFRELRGTLDDVESALERVHRDPLLNAEGRDAVARVIKHALYELLDEYERYERETSPFEAGGADPEEHAQRVERIRLSMDQLAARVLRSAPGSVAPAAATARDARIVLDTAQDLSSLAAWQAEALADLRERFDARHAEIAARLQTLRAAASAKHEGGGEGHAATTDRLQRQNHIRWLEFQKAEVDARTLAWIDALMAR